MFKKLCPLLRQNFLTDIYFISGIPPEVMYSNCLKNVYANVFMCLETKSHTEITKWLK